MNKRYYEHTLPIIRGSLSNTYKQKWPKDGILGPFLLDHSLYKPVPKILSGRQYFLKLDGPVVPASQFAS